MTPREPDRYEARCGVHGQRPWWREGHCICPELRAAESSALERAKETIRVLDLEHLGAFYGSAEGVRREILNRLEQGEEWRHPCACEKHRALIPPAAAPAADKVSDLLGRGHVRNPREGEPGDAETYSSPAPLLPRVLAALEQEASNHDEYDSRYEYERAALLRAIAAELRAYIAKAKGEGT